MIRSRLRTSAVIALMGPLLLQACDNHLPTAPSAPAVLDRTVSPAVRAPNLAVCPTRTTESVTGMIGPTGGSLKVAGHKLNIPAGAVSSPTTFTLTAPAGRYLKLEITAGDSEHYRFSAPVAVTISYARCKRQNLARTSFAAWYIDTESEVPLAYMGGRSNPERKTLTFSTDHLSTYAVAY